MPVGEAGNTVPTQADKCQAHGQQTAALTSGLPDQSPGYIQRLCCQAVLSIRCTPESEKTGSLSSPTLSAYVACK